MSTSKTIKKVCSKCGKNKSHNTHSWCFDCQKNWVKEHYGPQYRIWVMIRQRCNNPDYPDYPRYGGRGVTVCDEWNDFDSFKAWTEENGWKPGYHIHRINNSGDYSPENCVCISGEEHRLLHGFQKLSTEERREIKEKYMAGGVLQRELADEYDVCVSTISRAVNHKYS